MRLRLRLRCAQPVFTLALLAQSHPAIAPPATPLSIEYSLPTLVLALPLTSKTPRCYVILATALARHVLVSFPARLASARS